MKKTKRTIYDPTETPNTKTKNTENLDFALKLSPILCKLAFMRHAALSMDWIGIPNSNELADAKSGMAFILDEISDEIKALGKE